MASLKVKSTTQTTITVYITNLDPNYNQKQRTVYWSAGIEVWGISPSYTKINNLISQTDNITLEGFSSGTTYKITAKIVYYDANDNQYSTTLSVTATTKSEPVTPTRPNNWSWSSSVATALQNKGNIDTLTYTEWNNFVDRVQAFLKYKSKSTSTIGNAKMSSTDKVMTAVRFNIVRECINSMNATGISQQNPGDPVFGSYFITLASKLNGIT